MDDIRPVIREDDRRSMTYAEIAAARRISADSAVRLVRRKRWAKQAGNDGTVRVLVPAVEAIPASVRSPGRQPGGHPPAPPADMPSVIREAIREVIQPLTALIEAANRRADQAERRLADKDATITGLVAEQQAMRQEVETLTELLRARRWWPWRRR
jgi:C4-dicarboxylate-specific signal transduction histidine kinase